MQDHEEEKKEEMIDVFQGKQLSQAPVKVQHVEDDVAMHIDGINKADSIL
jgi:hypothetical protein